MAEQKHRDSEEGRPARPPGSGGETFKREGPEPAERSTGRTVDEMNEKARDALQRNIRPARTEVDDPE